MPELPEVETVKRFLQSHIKNQRIKKIMILKPRLFIGNPQDIIGAKIISVSRRAKILLFNLDNQKVVMVHFKLSGQMVWQPKTGRQKTFGHPFPLAGVSLPAKTTHIIIYLNKGILFYNDLRQFGWIKILTTQQAKEKLSQLGVEPFSTEFNFDYLKNIFSRSRRAIKVFLMDQHKIAGIGNIYSNDGLWEAGIDPRRPANSLNDQEIKKLKKGILKVLQEGIKYKGSSARDRLYILPNGQAGGYQYHFRVYQRKGEKCYRCGNIIQRIKLAARSTFFCSSCQK